jgi:hypothetical protein
MEITMNDFIVPHNEIIKPSEINKVKKCIPKVDYEIQILNKTELVLNRKTTRTDKTFVFSIRKGLYYIIDNKSKLTIKLTYNNTRAFFKDIGSEKYLEIKESLRCVDVYHRYLEDNLVEFSKYDNIPELINKDLVDLNSNIPKRIIEVHKNNKAEANIILSLANKYNKTEDIEYKLRKFIVCFNIITNKINKNNAIIFFKEYFLSNMKIDDIEDFPDIFINIINKYNIKFTRLIEYLFFELYTQGIINLNTGWKNSIMGQYEDYLNMTFEMFGKIKNKYPKHLKTSHDKIVLKYNLWKKYNKEKIFSIKSDDYKKYEFENKKYSIIIPKDTKDIVSEGIDLSHCVASYIDKILKGETFILFMREKENIDESLLTIEIKNNKINQVKGYSQREPNEEEIKFIEKWAKEKKLNR